MVLSAIGLGTAALGGIWGAYQSAKAGNQARRDLAASHERTQNSLRSWYNTDYISRPDSQMALTETRQAQEDVLKRAMAMRSKGILTDEGVAMMQNSANSVQGSTMGSIAAKGNAMKDNIMGQMIGEAQSYGNNVANLDMAKGQALAAAGSQMMSAGMNMIGADKRTPKEDKEAWGWLMGKG